MGLQEAFAEFAGDRLADLRRDVVAVGQGIYLEGFFETALDVLEGRDVGPVIDSGEGDVLELQGFFLFPMGGLSV